jgi:hypothetical protein
VNVRLDLSTIIYTREIYSFMNYLSDIGGLFNSVFVGGKIIVSLFIDKLFYSHIMKEIYQVDERRTKTKKKN